VLLGALRERREFVDFGKKICLNLVMFD